MEKCMDADVLKKHVEIGQRQGSRLGAFSDFRRQFAEYQRAKKGRKAGPRSLCRPHVEAFRQPHRGGNR